MPLGWSAATCNLQHVRHPARASRPPPAHSMTRSGPARSTTAQRPAVTCHRQYAHHPTRAIRSTRSCSTHSPSRAHDGSAPRCLRITSSMCAIPRVPADQPTPPPPPPPHSMTRSGPARSIRAQRPAVTCHRQYHKLPSKEIPHSTPPPPSVSPQDPGTREMEQPPLSRTPAKPVPVVQNLSRSPQNLPRSPKNMSRSPKNQSRSPQDLFRWPKNLS